MRRWCPASSMWSVGRTNDHCGRVLEELHAEDANRKLTTILARFGGAAWDAMSGVLACLAAPALCVTRESAGNETNNKQAECCKS